MQMNIFKLTVFLIMGGFSAVSKRDSGCVKGNCRRGRGILSMVLVRRNDGERNEISTRSQAVKVDLHRPGDLFLCLNLVD